MTNPRPDHDMALPHVGLLAYFRRPASAPPQLDVEASPPPYDRNTLHQAVFLDDATPKSNDEEATFGFWGEREHGKARPHVSHPSMLKRGYHGASAFFCFWFAVSVCILGAFGAFFVVDLVFTRLGMGTGMATWMVHRNVGRGVASYEMQFCLATPNRQAPGPQTWRYVEGEGVSDCMTEVLTLLASSNEVWKALSNDNVVFDDVFPLVSGDEVPDRVVSIAEKTGMELGDDLAEEGVRRH